MKIGKYKVKYTYKPARIICDIISLMITVVSIVLAAGFVSEHPEIMDEAVRSDLILIWVFPAVCVIAVAAYAALTFKSRSFKKYSITKENAQSVFEWYVFAVSLCKLPIQFAAVEGELVTQERLLGLEKSFFSFTYIFCALIIIIIIRFSVHRITALTKTNNKKSGEVFVKTYIADSNNENKDEREKK